MSPHTLGVGGGTPERTQHAEPARRRELVVAPTCCGTSRSPRIQLWFHHRNPGLGGAAALDLYSDAEEMFRMGGWVVGGCVDG